jgi:isochorismate synthase / 2-succinyl-5-enolpyruvyl-6-hydroxy-3-cyclohexene-1-carboxylate synthase / 2-succinyl-6-hydroxy-2,4-cyclohexadiene-1-carboxylate synthase / o-succinylbenzoate synthase
LWLFASQAAEHMKAATLASRLVVAPHFGAQIALRSADEFTTMWATPSHVDLQALCEAHRIPFQSVSELPDLLPTLRSAWDRKAASVVEVITDRHTNVAVHQQIQGVCTSAARRALSSIPPLPLPAPAPSNSSNGTGCHSLHDAPAAPATLAIHSVQLSEYSLPLAAPLTTGAAASDGRRGHLVRITLARCCGGSASQDAAGSSQGVGDAAPLPGLHQESVEEAGAQLAALSEVLQGCRVAPELALLEGALEDWWREVAGVHPASLAPSVRFAVECALVDALAQSCGRSFVVHALSCAAPPGSITQLDDAGSSSSELNALPGGSEGAVHVNALLDPGALSADQLGEQARGLVEQGYTCIKVKVCSCHRALQSGSFAHDGMRSCSGC